MVHLSLRSALTQSCLVLAAQAVTYKSSFTQYGSGDQNGSGNCNTLTTACGFFTNGPAAAISQNIFGVGPGAGAGPGCGTCWKLTIETDSTGKQVATAGKTLVVKANNLCPIDGNPPCSQQTTSDTNPWGANVNFDLCLNSGANSLFDGAGTQAAMGNATQVDCSEWQGTDVGTEPVVSGQSTSPASAAPSAAPSSSAEAASTTPSSTPVASASASASASAEASSAPAAATSQPSSYVAPTSSAGASPSSYQAPSSMAAPSSYVAPSNTELTSAAAASAASTPSSYSGISSTSSSTITSTSTVTGVTTETLTQSTPSASSESSPEETSALPSYFAPAAPSSQVSAGPSPPYNAGNATSPVGTAGLTFSALPTQTGPQQFTGLAVTVDGPLGGLAAAAFAVLAMVL